ncbi:metallophosphoesterase [Promethearchaeum syntrophicum]|uniref:Metallophosphoesterase n=1 Tax=Promethearchaeum syntrophicum TaxID=2594042 RepID=A0A5B9DF46_9ARCH|nr:metallophosphoesterase [Candidatus Prometheoarchaeum syntrophicum]QEE17959.1 Calcineurin-like phosphoesterase [Candidatus Prometheoarchaeum syntrophicum]
MSINLEKNKPSKANFRVLNQILLSLVFFSILIIEFVLFIDFSGDNFFPGTKFDFFGIEMAILPILIIVCLFLTSVSTIGLIFSLKIIVSGKKKSEIKRYKAPIIAFFLILGIGLISLQYYYPIWPGDLGIPPKFGPYIGLYGENDMIISWDCNQEETFTLLWGTEMDNLSNEKLSSIQNWIDNDKIFHHTVIFDSLNSGNDYYYSIPQFSKEIYSFKTAPSFDSGENVVFTIVGDTQAGFAIPKKNINLMLSDPDGLDFTCIAGDLVNRGDKINEWARLFNKKTYGRITSSIPWMNAPGNHETYCENVGCGFRENYKLFFQYDYPGNKIILNDTPDYGLYYSYNYSNVHMIALDNFQNETYTRSQGKSTGSSFTTAQLEWLEDDLSRNSDMWKFVYFHVPMFSMADSGPNIDIINQLEPIFEKYQVDAVFSGHDHYFDSFLVNSTYHFVVGGGGVSIEPMMDQEKFGDLAWLDSQLNVSETEGQFDQVFGSEYQLFGELCNHYLKIKVQGDTATFTAIRSSDGSTIIEYILE